MPDRLISQELNTDPCLRRLFFERLAAGALPPEQFAEGARLLGMDRMGRSCAVAVFSIPPEPRQKEDFFSPASAVREELMAHFLKYSEYIAFPWGPGAYAAVIQSQAARMPALTDRCAAAVRAAYENASVPMPWYAAVSDIAPGLQRLPELLRQADRLWALRYFQPERHILRGAPALPVREPDPGSSPLALDPRLDGTAAVRAFLQRGWAEEIPLFADWFVQTALGGARTGPLAHYGLISALQAARQYALALGLSEQAAGDALGPLVPADWAGTDLRAFLEALLSRALALRADAPGAAERGSFALALEHISERLSDPDLSLEETARAADMNPAYLSALFRRRMGLTFTAYVTGRRMDLAKRLLLATDRRPGQIAREAGYRDQHYFSTVFKKTQGCTPTAFRTSRRGGG